MKILLISDTHGDNEIISFLIKKYPNMDMYLHAGDSQTNPEDLLPFVSVKGNCDYFYDLNDKIIIHSPFGKLLMQHVPNVLLSQLKKENVRIFIHGHTHKRRFDFIDGIYYISPGSATRERDEFENTYAILDITKDKVSAEFFDIV